MTRISLNTYIAAGLLFWGIPAIFVVGPQVILYILVAVVPVWLLRYRESVDNNPPPRPASVTTCLLVVGFSLIYLIYDANLGTRALQDNLFLHGAKAPERVVDKLLASVGQGGSVADLLSHILFLMPFAMIDMSRELPRSLRILLWTVAGMFIFYEEGSGRAPILMAVLGIAAASRMNWRRALLGGGTAVAVFEAASALRGDFANTQAPLADGVLAPFVNLTLMTNANCGHAQWYSFLFEFFKKFIPAVLIPKTVFSFNAEMSWCIDPSNPNLSAGVSIFTWMGEILYYTPPLLTAALTGIILALLGRVLDRILVRNRMPTARIMAGLLCITMSRSRAQDEFSFLIAQIIFFVIIWPSLRNASRVMGRFLPPLPAVVVGEHYGNQQPRGTSNA